MCALSGSDEPYSYESLLRLKVELQSLGLRISGNRHSRLGGAGPAEGRAVLLGPLTATVPLASKFVRSSPYTAQSDEAGCTIFKNGVEQARVELAPIPKFYEMKTPDNVPFSLLALLHGRDWVGPADVQALVAPVLEHRVMLTSEARYGGRAAGDVLADLVRDTPVPE